MKELSIFINNESKTPIYEQIYKSIRDKIITNQLKKGDKLPSTRLLAQHLQISRSTILLAYEQLIAEGYVEAVERRGYMIVEIDETLQIGRKNDKIASYEEKKETEVKVDFTPNGIEAEFFPFDDWKKISKQIFDMSMKALFNSGDKKGEIGLRKLLSEYLYNSRGVDATPDRIFIGSGNDTLLQLVMDLINVSGFAMENPTYIKTKNFINKYTDNIIPVNLDKYGIDVELLRESNANVVYVTPSHQYPLGIVMGINRRQELLNWAYEGENRYIIEDDYDSEFRYKGKPIPSLQSIDTKDKVIYMGTFSKSISPAIRMNYMVLPENLCAKFEKIKEQYSNTVSRIDQKLMELFILNGGFERHLNKMRKIYKNKHEFLLSTIKKWEKVSVSGENAGAHIVLTVNNGMTEENLVRTAMNQGIRVYPLSEQYFKPELSLKNTVILGFAQLGIEDMKKGLGILAKVWGIKEKAED